MTKEQRYTELVYRGLNKRLKPVNQKIKDLEEFSQELKIKIHKENGTKTDEKTFIEVRNRIDLLKEEKLNIQHEHGPSVKLEMLAEQIEGSDKYNELVKQAIKFEDEVRNLEKRISEFYNQNTSFFFAHSLSIQGIAQGLNTLIHQIDFPAHKRPQLRNKQALIKEFNELLEKEEKKEEKQNQEKERTKKLFLDI